MYEKGMKVLLKKGNTARQAKAMLKKLGMEYLFKFQEDEEDEDEKMLEVR